MRGLGREARDMMELSPRLIAYNFGYLALVWAVAIGAIVVFWAHPAWYTFALAFLVVSSRQQALLNCEHECIHKKFVRGRQGNDLVGRWLCAAGVGSPYSASSHRHLTHHRLLATPEDPDRELYSGDDKRTRTGLARHFIGGLLGAYAGMVLLGPPAAKSGSPGSGRKDAVSILVLQGLLIAGFTVAFAWWVYPVLWLVPLVTVTVLFHLVRSYVEHAVTERELASHENRLVTIASNPVERAMIAPYGMNYHAEHHILPSVPAPRLKRLKKRLTARADTPPVLSRSSYGAAMLRHVRALRD